MRECSDGKSRCVHGSSLFAVNYINTTNTRYPSTVLSEARESTISLSDTRTLTGTQGLPEDFFGLGRSLERSFNSCVRIATYLPVAKLLALVNYMKNYNCGTCQFMSTYARPG